MKFSNKASFINRTIKLYTEFSRQTHKSVQNLILCPPSTYFFVYLMTSFHTCLYPSETPLIIHLHRRSLVILFPRIALINFFQASLPPKLYLQSHSKIKVILCSFRFLTPSPPPFLSLRTTCLFGYF